MLINRKVRQYIDTLTNQFPGIKSIWLMGSHANDSYRDDSDWDLFAFADQHIFDRNLQRKLDSGKYKWRPVAKDVYGRTIVKEKGK